MAWVLSLLFTFTIHYIFVIVTFCFVYKRENFLEAFHKSSFYLYIVFYLAYHIGSGRTSVMSVPGEREPMITHTGKHIQVSRLEKKLLDPECYVSQTNPKLWIVHPFYFN